MKPTVAFHTLGCKLNFADTGGISRLFESEGYLKVPFDAGADVYVINTCSVTENADRECRTIVQRALKKNPEAFIAVAGCYAQLKPLEIARMDGVDLVLGASAKFNVMQHIGNHVKNKQAKVFSCDIANAVEFNPAYTSGERTRAFLKVQDGCDYHCSFCTIPLARGKSRSNSIERIVQDVNEILQNGIREIVLTGVNLGDFHYESIVTAPANRNGLGNSGSKKIRFIDLIKTMDRVDADVRFRISSIEPNLLDDEIAEFVAASEKIVPHFHIPLQSGSDKILKRMSRRYLSGFYLNRIEKIRSLMPDGCIGADVIVGFPGESEEDFEHTLGFIQRLDINYLHVFTYSERAHTPAASFSGRVDPAERKRRNKILRKLSNEMQLSFYKKNIGTLRTVLFENEINNNFLCGYTENYVRIKYPFRAGLINTFQPIEITGINPDGTCSADLLKIPAEKKKIFV